MGAGATDEDAQAASIGVGRAEEAEERKVRNSRNLLFSTRFFLHLLGIGGGGGGAGAKGETAGAGEEGVSFAGCSAGASERSSG
jgi:hypothetical protein